MKVQVNGDAMEVDPPAGIASVLRALRVEGRRVAVVVNGRVVPEAQREAFDLKENDCVEVLTFAGGG